jgi:hypothetical protein
MLTTHDKGNTPTLPMYIGKIGNARLLDLQAISPDYINAEKTVAASIGDIHFLTDNVDPSLIARCMRFIIVDSQCSTEPYEIRSSPLECGRVLEANDQIEINGIPYTVTTKGCGTTRFYRLTGAESKYLTVKEKQDISHDPTPYTERAYFGVAGLLDKDVMQSELYGSEIMRALQIKTQTNLAWAPLLALPHQDGIPLPIQTLKNEGLVYEESEPVLMIRAVRSNFRLMDFVNFHDRKDPEGMKWLLQHTKDLYQDSLGSRISTQRLYTTIMKQLVDDMLTICFAGYNPCVHFADDLARNITIAGEWIDLDDLEQSKVRSPYDVSYNFQRQSQILLRAGAMIGGALNSISTQEITMNDIALHYIDSLRTRLKSGDADSLYEQLSETRKKEVKLNSFRYEIFQSCASYFSDYAFLGRFRDIQQKASRTVQNYLDALRR